MGSVLWPRNSPLEASAFVIVKKEKPGRVYAINASYGIETAAKLDTACWDCFLGAHFHLLDEFATPSWRVAPGHFVFQRFVTFRLLLPATLPSHYGPHV